MNHFSQYSESKFEDKLALYRDMLIKSRKIICKLLIMPESDWKAKLYGNVLLADLVSTKRIVENYDKTRFVEQLYLSLLVLRDLYRYRHKLVKKASENIADVSVIIDEYFDTVKSLVGERTKAVEETSGYSSLFHFDLPNSKFSAKTSELMKMNAKMLGSIAFFFKKLTEPYSHNFTLMSLKETSEYFEIMRILQYESDRKHLDQKLNAIGFSEKVFFDSDEYLKKVSKKSECQSLLKSLPQIFDALCKIYKDPECTWEIKHKINSAFAYVAMDENVMCAKKENGMIDDLFILGLVLLDVYYINKKTVYQNLKSMSVSELMSVLERTGMAVNYNVGEILNYLGLKGLFDFFDIRKDVNDYFIEQEIGILIRQNNRLKRILLDLAKFALIKPVKLHGGEPIDALHEKIRENLKDGSFFFESNVDEFDDLIKISQKLSYAQNIEEILKNKENEETKLLLLKHKILSDG